MNKLFCTLVFLVFLLPGCAPAAPNALEGVTDLLTDGFAPASLGRGLHLSQIVTGRFAEKIYSLRLESDVQPDKLVIAGFTHIGVTIFTIQQTPEATIISERMPDSVPFDLERLLMNFKLVYWPMEKLSPALELRGFHLIEEKTGGSYRRVLLNPEGGIVVEIVAPGDDQKEIIVRHHDISYNLRIRTLVREETAS